MAKESTLGLVIPCRVDGKKEGAVEPIHVFVGLDSTGAAMTEWRCPHCGMQGPRRKPLCRHMGLGMNVPASCRTLREQDDRRRLARASRDWLFGDTPA